MENAGESKSYIIGWLSSMIQCQADEIWENYSIQESIDNGVKFYTDRALLAGRKANVDSELATMIINANGKE